MTKSEWIERCAVHLAKRQECEVDKSILEWAKSLHETYTEDDPNYSPEEAADEDLSYT